jgi:hypothetical protein
MALFMTSYNPIAHSCLPDNVIVCNDEVAIHASNSRAAQDVIAWILGRRTQARHLLGISTQNPHIAFEGTIVFDGRKHHAVLWRDECGLRIAQRWRKRDVSGDTSGKCGRGEKFHGGASQCPDPTPQK